MGEFRKETTYERRARLLRDRTHWEINFGARLKSAGIWFDEQVPIGPYFADFVLVGKVVVELDGKQHLEPESVAYDERRTHFMSNQGYRVFRVMNADAGSVDLDRFVPEVLVQRPPKPKKQVSGSIVGPAHKQSCPTCRKRQWVTKQGIFTKHHRKKRKGPCPGSGQIAPPRLKKKPRQEYGTGEDEIRMESAHDIAAKPPGRHVIRQWNTDRDDWPFSLEDQGKV